MPSTKKSSGKKAAKRSYGWKPDLPDHRDIPFSAVYKIPKKLPPSVDLRSICSKVEDQGQLGSCTANALVGALEALQIKSNKSVVDMSRLFVYYNERVIEKSVNHDSGAQIRDGIKTLVKQGACTEQRWPYNIAQFTVKPGPACYKEGLNYQVTSYQRIESLDQMRSCLAAGFPFVFGFTVYESFESQAVARSGVLSMPKHGEKMMGGHAVLAVGYTDADKRFLVRNSWGEDWGQKGYFTMPYAYLDNRNLSDDIWTIRAEEM